jgi:hypothetical protein
MLYSAMLQKVLESETDECDGDKFGASDTETVGSSKRAR